MQRIHAFEFTDLNAVPDFIRSSIVEVLGDALRRAGFYESAADTFLEFLYDEKDFRAMAENAGGDYSWHYREFPFVLGGKGVAFYGVPEQNRSQGNQQGQGG